ncbi:MAG: LptF/LptG family permease [Cytophagales bacterium]|uniref:LptF/LptG family permease n=1 Tax=Cyclobacterium marinum TaxID=104 RepID=UPI0030D78BED|nr:LptF/LptG family permease [Cytophagales bacterium]|tara:strand:+ start:1077 stop:2906 length:1830 start_codon:yes stop_codon:yes gene_type:complete
MKKLDKLVLGSFLSPFLLTFIVVDFILLTVNMLKYFDEIFGKDLPFMVYMELIGYFVISISPMALPLAVLLSSLMTFGNLGEHFELTAIKSSGISLNRTMLPIGVFVAIVTILAFLSNNYIVPRVNLKTFSLLYDIRMKSPAFDIKEGVFYNGIPGYSIKVNNKLDEVRLQDVLIYDHTSGQGNLHVITADSGRMEPFFNDRYIMLTLYHGNSYQEGSGRRGGRNVPQAFSRTQFETNKMVFNLDAFELDRTDEKLWSNSKSIKNIREIRVDLDSMEREINHFHFFNYANTEASYNYFGRSRKLTPPKDILDKKLESDSLKNLRYQAEHDLLLKGDDIERASGEGSAAAVSSNASGGKNTNSTTATDTSGGVAPPVKLAQRGDSKSSVASSDTLVQSKDSLDKALANNKNPDMRDINKNSSLKLEKPVLQTLSDDQEKRLDSLLSTPRYRNSRASVGLTSARNIKNNFTKNKTQINEVMRQYRHFTVAWYQKYTQSLACFVMFMIGAPLGAIIKKGGLGMPVLLSIIFFIMYYMLTITGEKWAKEGLSDPLFGTFFSNMALIPFGLFFLKQARKDARLFEPDFYQGIWEKIVKLYQKLVQRKKLKEDVL